LLNAETEFIEFKGWYNEKKKFNREERAEIYS
jgi:hypothetical protein